MEHSGDRASWSEKLQTRKHPVSPPPSPLTKPLRIPPLPLARASLSDKTLSCLSLSLSLFLFRRNRATSETSLAASSPLEVPFRMWGVQPNSTLSVVHILANSETIAASRAFACPGLDLVSTSRRVATYPSPSIGQDLREKQFGDGYLRNLAVLGQARVCVVKSSEDSRRVGISTARQGSGSSKAQPLFGRGRRGRASDPHCWPSAFGADHADRFKPIRKGLAPLAGCR